ncbi:MAG: SagB/ThcOx family dehydrogenase [Candidatus Omnitrophica bacterium]|nr:SagB/ThcOx family dehydrogenase [Candidatus Omnitrophota bacterium]
MSDLPGDVQYREFLKDTVRRRVDFSKTDQGRGIPPPPFEKAADPQAARIVLPKRAQWTRIGSVDLAGAMNSRRSRRKFAAQPFSLEETAFLLWAAQGLQRKFGDTATFRTVPSAGARHAFETYVCALRIEALPRGIYRYLPLSHELVCVYADAGLAAKLVAAALGQEFLAATAATFIWTAVPYRMEWRYGAAAGKVIALDAGHVCQNLYLACEAINAGACAIAAYDQQRMDELVRADGKEEFSLYLCATGKR